jgi:hypothetical protein
VEETALAIVAADGTLRPVSPSLEVILSFATNLTVYTDSARALQFRLYCQSKWTKWPWHLLGIKRISRLVHEKRLDCV